MKNYLVTGAAGFIGGALAKRLLLEGNRVVSIDNLSTGNKDAIPKGVEFYEADCQDPLVYEKLPNITYDTIFHIAGQSSGEISFEDPTYDLRTNTESTLLLLKFALEKKCMRFIYASTMSVYGDQPDQAVSEAASTSPKSFYGVGKLASENYLNIYENYGIKTTSLRLFNVYGPGQNLNNLKQGMVSIFLAQMLENNKVVVKGSPDRYRDFIYIDDVVEAFISTSKNPTSFGMSLNIATGIKHYVKDVLEELSKHSTAPIEIIYEGNTPGDQFGIFANTEKAEKEIGFKAQTSFASGIQKMWKWATTN